MEGTEWVLVTLPGAPPPPPGARATLLMERERSTLSVSSGCNTFDGAYQLVGARLTLGLGERTWARCGPELARLETDYLDALRRTGSYRLRGDTLELLGELGVSARFRAPER